MQILKEISDVVKPPKGCVLTIGNFDGVHLGHRRILAAAKQAAAKNATQLVVMTFEPHPLAVLNPEKAPGNLTPLALKKHLLAEPGVDILWVIESTTEILRLSPAAFVEEFVVKHIQPKIMVEGEDFNFGRGRRGSIQTLRNLGSEKGFEVIVIEPKEVKLSIGRSVRVSSTMIRNLLQSGRVCDAAVALGRPYRLIGKVVRGRGKGKKLGFPTANIQRSGQLIPAEGVYAGFVGIAGSEERVCACGERIPAAFSIGRSSTCGGDNPLIIESHLLAEDVGDLVGNYMAMDFIERIREQQRFESETELSAHIAKDCETARSILAVSTC